MSRACEKCGARLSRYTEPDTTMCAPCWTASDPSYESHLDTIAVAIRERERGRGDVYCTRGHNLLDTGDLVNAGGGRMTRRCAECRKINQREYQRKRRANLKAAA